VKDNGGPQVENWRFSQTNPQFDLLVMDASGGCRYTLITREAFQILLRHLTPGF